MESRDSRFARLMGKYIRKEHLTDEDWRFLKECWDSSPEYKKLAEQFSDEEWIGVEMDKFRNVPMERMWAEINRQLDDLGEPDFVPEDEPARRPWLGRVLRARGTRVAAAALVLGGGYWLFQQYRPAHPEGKEKDVVTAQTAETAERDFTIWTDDSGRRVLLDSVPVGNVVVRAGEDILRKVDYNALAYDRSDATAKERPDDAPAFYRNCLAIGEKSGPYHLQVQDGSSVWLTAGTRLQYPNGRRRTRSGYFLTGKALFDIAHDPSRPLVIDLPNGQQVKVLGTSFSIDAAKENRRPRVAVLDGKVRFYNHRDSIPLGAGEEATAEDRGFSPKKIENAAGENSWVGNAGSFHFVDAGFDAAIAQIAAWYGLKVVKPANLKASAVTIELPRSPSPATVLKTIDKLENGYVHLSLKNNKIIVSEYSTK